MKILLTTLNAKYIHINLAIRMLYELNKHHKELTWKEFTIKENPIDIANAVLDNEIIAFSCYIWNISQTLAVAREIKKINNNIKILLGGPEVSYEYDDIINKDEVDYIIIGEGEIPFSNFLNNYPNIENIGNLIYKKNNKINLLPLTETFDLNLYKGINPYINDSPQELYNKVCYIESSRGCPYKCEFCLASLDNNMRYLPMDDIKAHLLYLMQHGRTIKFLDRTFNVKKTFTIEIFEFILANYKPGQVFQFEITADIVHPDIITYIQKNVPKGLMRFEIGIQTVNQKANLQINRKQNFDKTSNIIKQLDYIIEMHLDLIVGLPLDEWEDIKYSIEEVFKLHPPELQLGFLKFLKGTPMRLKQEKHGYIYDPEPPYQMIESKYLSKNQLLQITYLEESLEIYWNKKRAIHTLKYVGTTYSIFDFLLYLGNYFKEKNDFHKHSLNDVYDNLYNFSKINYPNDTVLLQLISIDYYLQAKIKPQIRYIEEISKNEKHKIIEKHGLDHHLYRFIIIEINFEIEKFIQNNEITNQKSYVVFQYNGTEKAKLVLLENKLLESI